MEERSFGATDGGEPWASVRTTFAFRESPPYGRPALRKAPVGPPASMELEASGDTGRGLADGRDRWVRRSLLARCETRGRCSAEKVDAEGKRERLVGTCAPELFGAAAEHCVPLGGLSTPLERDEEALRFHMPTGDVVVGLDATGTPAWIEAGALRGERVSGAVDLHPVDVAALTAQPVERIDNARSARVGEYQVDGAPLRLEVPTSAELPARDVARIARLVEEVATAASTSAGCKEHAARLMMAARKAGYAARTVYGRVYVENEVGASMVLHAWVELEIGGRWVGADSAFRQFPADATHIPLGGEAADLVASDAEITVIAVR